MLAPDRRIILNCPCPYVPHAEVGSYGQQWIELMFDPQNSHTRIPHSHNTHASTAWLSSESSNGAYVKAEHAILACNSQDVAPTPLARISHVLVSLPRYYRCRYNLNPTQPQGARSQIALDHAPIHRMCCKLHAVDYMHAGTDECFESGYCRLRNHYRDCRTKQAIRRICRYLPGRQALAHQVFINANIQVMAGSQQSSMG
jgi:hypothetical protein